MAKAKTIYSCTKCGAQFPRWQGQCSECGEWNSIEEDTPVAAGLPTQTSVSKAKPIKVMPLNAPTGKTPRTETTIKEFDRVLGGGLVKGCAILLGGDPGIGKSTFLLQMTAKVGEKLKVLYTSGEESTEQIQMRANRLGVSGDNIQLAVTGSLEKIIATMQSEKPDVLVVDSIQTVHSDGESSSLPGSISQIRLAAHTLINAAKSTGTILILVGHVTKQGNIAGPRVLEHMVDTVLYFEGEHGHPFRIMRSFKNRFGATDEIGVFEMTDTGLKEVANPSALLLSEKPEDAPGSVVLAAMNGTRPILVEIQALVSKSALAQPRRTTVGVDPNRLSMIAAVLDKHAGYNLSGCDIYLNVTGGFKVTEPAADLAIASALISSMMNQPVAKDRLVFGELGLSGEIRSVSHTRHRLQEAKKLGFSHIVCPNIQKDIPVEKVNIHTISNLRDAEVTLCPALFGKS